MTINPISHHSNHTHRQINLVIPVVKQAITGKLVAADFKVQKGVNLKLADNMIDPTELGYEGHRDDIRAANKVAGLPTEWQQPKFKNEIIKFINHAVSKVIHSDGLILTGGKDFTPELLGHKRHEKTETKDIFDARDAVEAYAILTAVANGKMVHGTCRGMQAFTSMMLETFSDPEKPNHDSIKIKQHLPEFLGKHSGNGLNDHHSGGNFALSLSDIIKKEGWLKTIMKEQIRGEQPIFSKYKEAIHAVKVFAKPSLLKDALLIVKENNPDITLKNGIGCTNMASVHHQGFAFKNRYEYKLFRNALKKTGGRVTAVSAHEGDGKVVVIEGIEYSKLITGNDLTMIKKMAARLNEVTGFNIKIPMPDLSKGPVRMDAHTVQPHPELNLAKIALGLAALTTCYTRDKKSALEQGLDIGGYDAWSKKMGLNELKQITEASIKQKAYKFEL